MRAAVIGIGWIGFRYSFRGGKRASHVSSYLACPKTELVAVADVDRVKLEDFKIEHPDIAVYHDYEKMLSEAKPEIVSVCTAEDSHCKIVRNVARYEPVKAVFCEKPIAPTVGEAEEMIRTCEQFQTKLAVNHTRRWDDAYRLIKQILDGKWRDLPMSCARGAQAAEYYAQWGIGELLAFAGRFSSGRVRAGTHMADLYNWYSQANTKLSLLNVPTPYLVFEFDLIGSEGLIKIRDNGASIQLWKPKESERYIKLKELEHAATLDIKYDFPRAMLSAVEDLVECASSDKQPECTGSDGLYALGKCLEMEMLEIP